MIRVLIVYENVPESTAFYILEVSPEDWQGLKRCQGHFVNECDNPADKECLTLSTLLENLDDPKIDKLDLTENPLALSDLHLDYVLHTGFLL